MWGYILLIGFVLLCAVAAVMVYRAAEDDFRNINDD